MRFYWFDGQAPQGPYEIAELLKQPGFNAESVVCPVGASRAEDWKPAVNYEPLRDALFKPKPFLIIPPPPVQAPCPACRHDNPDDALFCNQCGQNIKKRPGPAAEQMVSLPSLPAPAAKPVSGPPPGKMGRIAALQEQKKIAGAAASRPPVSPAAASPAPAVAKKTSSALLSAMAFCVAFALLAGMSLLRRPARPNAPSKPAAAAPLAAKPAPQAEAAKPAATPPPVADKAGAAAAPARMIRRLETAVKPPPAQRPARKKPRRKKAAPQPAETRPSESQPPGPQPMELQPPLPKPQPVENSDEPKPAAPASPADKKEELLLPGIPKKVVKASDLQPPAPPQPQGHDPAEDKSPEQVMLGSAKEQFNFCHQLIRQGALGDFFDTCLCAAAKNAPPYKSQRRLFVEASSRDSAGEIGAAFEISAARVDGQDALITAKWSAPAGAIERTEKWSVEEGLWCRAQ